MKALNLMLLVFLLAGTAAAQAISYGTEVPGVKVIKNSWRREIRNPAFDEDPLRASEDQAALERSQKAIIEENVLRTKADQPLRPVPTVAASRPAPGRISDGYVYEVKIGNTGAKTITSLEWEYVLLDPNTQREVGRHRFTSEVRVRPGKSTTIDGRSKFHPANVVNAKQAGGASPEQYSERIVIQRIEYSDGSTWKRASR